MNVLQSKIYLKNEFTLFSKSSALSLISLGSKLYNLAPIKKNPLNVNVVKKFKKAPRGWKHALIRRNPKKNYKPEDLTTLRDISLLPTIYKIFAKCLCNRILPNVVGSASNFWQRAYIKKRDRQELIFLMQTAIDDFKHISSRFYAIFVDFRDAFGSLDQGYLIRALLESGVHKLYCELIADIYEDSHFEVICGQHLSKEFPLPVGTKTEV